MTGKEYGKQTEAWHICRYRSDSRGRVRFFLDWVLVSMCSTWHVRLPKPFAIASEYAAQPFVIAWVRYAISL